MTYDLVCLVRKWIPIDMVIQPVTEHLKANKESKHESHANADISQIVLVLLRRAFGMKHNAAVPLSKRIGPSNRIADRASGNTCGIFVLVLVNLVIFGDGSAGPLRNVVSHQNVLPAMKFIASSSVMSPSMTQTATF